MTFFIFDDLHDVRLTYKQTMEYLRYEPYICKQGFYIMDDHRSIHWRMRYIARCNNAPKYDPKTKIKAMRFFKRLKKIAYSRNKNIAVKNNEPEIL